jgi:hypothetical protein
MSSSSLFCPAMAHLRHNQGRKRPPSQTAPIPPFSQRTFSYFMLLKTEGVGLEPTYACARRFSRPVP